MKILGKLQTTDTATVTNLNADTLDGNSSDYFASKASPTFTGTVSAQTATLSDVLTLTGGGYTTTLDSKGYAGLLVNITGTTASAVPVEAFKLNPATTKGFLFGNELLTTANIPTLNQNTTGSSASCTGNAATVTTNANLTGHITSTGNATVLGSFSSAQLATALTDETGSGANVFATSPSLVTPILGTPASGNLVNCTFPTLNQNTTGSSASCTGNAATATNLSGGSVTTTTAGVMTAKSLELKAEIPKIALWDITDPANTDKYYLQANKNAFSISAVFDNANYQGKTNAPLYIEYKNSEGAESKSMWLFGTKIISAGELTTAITGVEGRSKTTAEASIATFKTDTIDNTDDAVGYSKRNHHHSALSFNNALYEPSLTATADTLVARDSTGAIAAKLPYSSLTDAPTIPTTLPASDVYAWAKAATKPSYAYSEITGTIPTFNQNTTGNAATAANALRALDTTKSSYGSVEIYGATNGWSGIRFDTPSSVFMVNNTNNSSGLFKENATWVWQFNKDGALVNGTVPWASVTGTPTIPTTLPASDVYAWAKAATKPSYAYSEITSTPTIPTTLPASDVYAWAKAATKPSYAYSEITSTPTIPTVYDWAKAATKPSYAYSEITGTKPSYAYSEITSTPTIPTVYDWAKAATKPSYAYSEITGNVTGTLTIAGGAQIYGGAQASITIGAITTHRTLDVSGALSVGGSTTIVGGTYSTTWAKASDDRLKTRLTKLNNVLPALNSLTCFNYTYNKLYQAITGQLDTRTYLGLSAQELNHAFPEAVVDNTLTDTEGNSYLGVSYEALIPVIIQAIKELTTAIEDLKTTNNLK